MGKGGHKIREIREVTKAKIHIGDKEGDSDRLIQIQGSEEEVMLAKHLIMMHIKRHNTKLKEGESNSCIEDRPELRAAATVLAKLGDI